MGAEPGVDVGRFDLIRYPVAKGLQDVFDPALEIANVPPLVIGVPADGFLGDQFSLGEGIFCKLLILLVPGGGLEPPRPCDLRILSPFFSHSSNDENKRYAWYITQPTKFIKLARVHMCAQMCTYYGYNWYQNGYHFPGLGGD